MIKIVCQLDQEVPHVKSQTTNQFMAKNVSHQDRQPTRSQVQLLLLEYY